MKRLGYVNSSDYFKKDLERLTEKLTGMHAPSLPVTTLQTRLWCYFPVTVHELLRYSVPYVAVFGEKTDKGI